MAFSAPDRLKMPRLFWTGLQKLGLTPAVVLRHAHLPLIAYEDESYSITTAQFFALWKSLEELCTKPDFILDFVAQLDFAALPLSTVAAYHARDYRDALSRHARYSQLCIPTEVIVEERKDEYILEQRWLYAAGEEPLFLTDAGFAILVELGRRGTQCPLNPKRIEFKHRRKNIDVLKKYFNCPINTRASRNALILHVEDMERLFVTFNAELLEMLQAQMEKRAEGYRIQASACEQVKWILRQMLAGGRPDIANVALELGVGVRTLQRRIDQEQTTFRDILLALRQELVREYLARPGIQINEVAFLLGYEDANSFYRAFRNWEGTTPAHWRVGQSSNALSNS
jgi:AraC-like DNA-binding protein